MVFRRGQTSLAMEEYPAPERPGPHKLLIRVRACGVCRTDLHILDGELAQPKDPVILGHEVVGVIESVGREVKSFRPGQRVGVPWLGWTCGDCTFCRDGQENLCERAKFTGYDLDGGFAEMSSVDERYAFPIPERLGDVEAAPLLCAGLIGYRALKLAGAPSRVGLYGFGAAAHIAAQIARFRGQQVYAFTRPGDKAGQDFARSLGCVWAGGSDERPPQLLEAALIFAPVGPLVPLALGTTRKGGTVVCAGIHMSDIPSFPYSALWGERVLRSVANLTRKDGDEFFQAAAEAEVRPVTTTFPLAQANVALQRLREGKLEGAAVLVP